MNEEKEQTYVWAWLENDGKLYVEQGQSLVGIIDYVICYFLIEIGEPVQHQDDVVSIEKHADIFVVKYMNEKHHIDANEHRVAEFLEQRARAWGYQDKFTIQENHHY